MPKKPTGQPTGRPPGKDYPKARTMLLTDEDLETLKRIATAAGCSGAEVVRRLIREEGKRLARAERRKGDEGHKGGTCAAAYAN